MQNKNEDIRSPIPNTSYGKVWYYNKTIWNGKIEYINIILKGRKPFNMKNCFVVYNTS